VRGDAGGESSEEGDYGDEDEASESDSFEVEDGEEEEVVIKRPKKVRKFSRAFESFVSMDSSITHTTLSLNYKVVGAFQPTSSLVSWKLCRPVQLQCCRCCCGERCQHDHCLLGGELGGPPCALRQDPLTLLRERCRTAKPRAHC